MKIITFFNNKGGVGKTTLLVNIAALLSLKEGKKILVLDADPQANTTQMVIPEEKWELYYGDNCTRQSIKDMFEPILDGDASVNPEITITTGSEHNFGFDLIPGHPTLSTFEDKLSEAWLGTQGGDIGGFRKTNWLNAVKRKFDDDYDLMFVDVGPSLGALNRSILLNSDFFITPMGSDIFSLMGIKNISEWIEEWEDKYSVAVTNALKRQKRIFDDYPLNSYPQSTTRFVGYCIQQYNARKFKDGRRPIMAYDRIISQIHSTITNDLSEFIPQYVVDDEELKLGDVPYLSSLIPLSQSANQPYFNLTYKDGIRGSQGNSVIEATEMITSITSSLMGNLGSEE